MNPLAVKQAIEQVLYTYGKPMRIRLDNGQPFANTKDRKIPTNLVLWLVALGIKVHFNQVGTPQQNGSVECTQRISSRWANPKNCQNSDQLQQALDQVTFEHIYVLRQRKNKDATRIMQYPELNQNARKYQPQQIDSQKAKDYLASFEWTRKVYDNGTISVFGARVGIGKKYKLQTVYMRFDPKSAELVITLYNGKTLKRLKGLDLSVEAIQNLKVIPDKFTTL